MRKSELVKCAECGFRYSRIRRGCPNCPKVPPPPSVPEAKEAPSGGERFKTLKAWVHWALKNPIDEHQAAHAKETNDLFALLGTREAEITRLRTELSQATDKMNTLAAELANNVTEDHKFAEECRQRAVRAEQERDELRAQVVRLEDDLGRCGTAMELDRLTIDAARSSSGGEGTQTSGLLSPAAPKKGDK